jgi:adenylate cyclase
MNIEIEKKFLVKNNEWKKLTAHITKFQQGYLCIDTSRTIRVRVSEECCWINIKGKTEINFRLEFEYEIPRRDALVLLQTFCVRPIIHKTRYKIQWEGLCWEIDEFQSDNEGLVLAEIELKSPDQPIRLPNWIGEDVTDNAAYYNASLVLNPYKNWNHGNIII